MPIQIPMFVFLSIVFMIFFNIFFVRFLINRALKSLLNLNQKVKDLPFYIINGAVFFPLAILRTINLD